MSQATLHVTAQDGGGIRLAFAGHLSVETASGAIADARKALDARASVATVTIDLADVTYFDSAGAAVIIALRRWCDGRNALMDIAGARPEAQGILSLLDVAALATSVPIVHYGRINLFERIGDWALYFANDLRQMLVFLGDASLAVLWAIRHPRGFRWRETLVYLERAGVDAVPIVLLINFLVGVTLAFLGASQLQQFGASIYVADLVGIAVAQEIGPLMTAIIIAGRSGASFAAEIGTMKVSEEVDALVSMGFDPQRFLVLPKILGVILAIPSLLLLANLVGIMGGALVGMSFLGLTITTYFHRIFVALTPWMITQGMIKAMVFGLLVAAVGCMRGLQAKGGAESVGRYTTSAVVTSIFMIVIANAVFTIVFQYI